MAPDERCERCRFFEQLSATCRVNPPRAYPVGVGAGGQVSQVTIFPVMQPSQWCGRFERDNRAHDGIPEQLQGLD